MMNTQSINELLGKVWSDLQQASMREIEAKAKANPRAYRDTTVMEGTKGTNYRFYRAAAGVGRKCQAVRFCYSVHRNAAGYYLSWIEIETKKVVKRFNIRGSQTKREAIDGCLERLRDSRKPKAERRFTIPSVTAQEA